MNSIISILTKIVSDGFSDCGYEGDFGLVTPSDRSDLCQFQCNGSFACAKVYRKAPVQIASEVADKISENEAIDTAVAAAPGFINIKLSDKFLLNYGYEVFKDEHLGLPQKSGKILIDYGGPNVAKPLHIGHLRSAIIGESLKRMAKALGRTVIGDVHLGDWGLQIGLVIAELSVRYPEYDCFTGKGSAIPDFTAEDLNEIYPFASKKSKEDKDFAELAHEITAALQKGDEGYTAIWKKIMEVSIADLKRNYDRLSVSFDLWYGESDAEKFVPSLLSVLTEKGLMYESEGAMVVDVALPDDKAPVPPVIIKKSDNSNIYATTDLATIIERQTDFAPDEIWYVVDKRQSLHFTQVFRCAKKAGLVPESCDLIHLGFGTMNGSDGKPFKTRDGGVMRLSDLLDSVVAASCEKIKSSEYVDDGIKNDIAEKTALAAIKFGDLINHRSKDYVFDIDKFLSFEGKTGTYLLYTITRINSVLAKLGIDKAADIVPKGIYSESERQLLLSLCLTEQAFDAAIKDKAPNFIADNAYKTASLFSQFYHDCPIVSEKDNDKKESLLFLCLYTKRMLEMQLSVLGIEPVERM